MKNLHIILFSLVIGVTFSQNNDFKKKQLQAAQKSNDFVYEANELVNSDDFVSAEMSYRKALSENASTVVGAYNLGNAYYKKGAYDEALYRHQQAIKNTTSREEKHKAFHNIGNILMQNKKCKEAVEAFKSALRNNPTDDESRYNLALAKECAKQQGDGEDENENEDKKDQNDKDKQDKEEKDKDKEDEGEDKDKPEDEGDQDKKEGDKDEDEDGKPKDDKKDQGEGDKKDQQKEKPQPKPGQLSPQQIKNLLEAMSDQEQKVQEKINAKKQKGVKIKTDKDW